MVVRLYRCKFQNCGHMLRVEKAFGFCCVKGSTSLGFTHNDHIEELDHGVPGQIRALLSPTKLELPPKKLRAYLRMQLQTKRGKTVEQARDEVTRLRDPLEAYQKCAKRRKSKERLGDAGRGTFGGLSVICEKLEVAHLKATNDFHAHKAFICGEPLIVPETGKVTLAISTENLLLNAYRQSVLGLPSLVCIDTTHRLVHEGTHQCSFQPATIMDVRTSLASPVYCRSLLHACGDHEPNAALSHHRLRNLLS